MKHPPHSSYPKRDCLLNESFFFLKGTENWSNDPERTIMKNIQFSMEAILFFYFNLLIEI